MAHPEEWAMTLQFAGGSPEAIHAAVEALSRGGVAILPADTVYDFFGRADVPDSVNRVYAIKQRDRGKPFMLYTNREQVAKWAELTPVARRLIDAVWPRPLGLLLPKTSNVPGWFTGGLPTLAVVTASNSIVAPVTERVPGPLFATTVNYSGERTVRNGEEARAFARDVDVFIDDDTQVIYNRPSTIVDCTASPPAIIREGTIPVRIIGEIIPDVTFDPSRLR
jgi:L-threonylcarbamoyladenylate synthase